MCSHRYVEVHRGGHLVVNHVLCVITSWRGLGQTTQCTHEARVGTRMTQHAYVCVG